MSILWKKNHLARIYYQKSYYHVATNELSTLKLDHIIKNGLIEFHGNLFKIKPYSLILYKSGSLDTRHQIDPLKQVQQVSEDQLHNIGEFQQKDCNYILTESEEPTTYNLMVTPPTFWGSWSITMA